MNNMIWVIVFTVIAYLIGSISNAVVICKIMKLPDPRESGSGNPGATNVYRTGNRAAALLVLVADIAKGLIAMWLAMIFGLSGLGLGLVGIAVILGHAYPIFFKFEGGKGVATAFGVVLALSLSLALITALIWLITAAIFRYASLASICAAISAVVFSLFFIPQYILAVLLMALIIVARHYQNINRLMSGTEDKIKL